MQSPSPTTSTPSSPPLTHVPRAPDPACRHCGNKTTGGAFCCEGCAQVYDLLQQGGLARYYELRVGAGQPAVSADKPMVDDAWIDVESERIGTATELTRVPLDIEGMHCTACVWLVEEIFRRTDSSGRVDVNAALGTIDLLVEPQFPLRAFVSRMGSLGYKLGPRRRQARRPSDALVLRMGVCVAIAMNSMLFAIARYAGLQSGIVEHLFRWLELGLALAAFAVGGTVFVKAAWRGVRARVLHLDMPIAIGLLLGYAGSIASFLFGDGASTYFDTLVIFTTLMLVGRFLRERVLEKNRAELLEDAGLDGILVRRVQRDASGETRVEIVPATELAVGDRIFVSPGDVLPIAAILVDAAASMSFDWITGESEPRAFRRGARVDAGAANHGRSAVQFAAAELFESSRLVDLLRVPRADERTGGGTSRVESTIARVWVIGVLVAASIGFGGHLLAGSSLSRAFAVAIAILVVTCPCAFGIASPIAHELVLGALRKRGMLIRSASFLERAERVRRVIFDKTGTLTTGTLALADTAALEALGKDDRAALYELAVRSNHPKASAILAAIGEGPQSLREGAMVEEIAGKGLVGTFDGHEYRLGSPRWAGSEGSSDVAFSRDGGVIAAFSTVEELRHDAAAEVAALVADGIECCVATGDEPERALSIAARCGIDPARVHAKLSPEDKAALLERVDREDTLMIGDGMNDALALRAAWCSGTLSIARTFIAARSDFCLLATGLGPIRAGLLAARALRRTVRRNLVWAASYNSIALGLSLAGLMSPLLAAILMPVSSIVSIGLVVRELGKKDLPWKC